MKLRYILSALTLMAVTACTSLDERVYDRVLLQLEVELTYPAGYEEYCRAGIAVQAVDVASAATYQSLTDAAGRASFLLPKGFYRLTATDRGEEAIFNGLNDRVRLTDGSLQLALPLTYSKPGQIIIREIYSGGCSKAPYEGTYQSDRYFILHNNDMQVQYLDGLCFGTLEPYNSNAPSGNSWTTTDPETGVVQFREYAPVVEAVWRLPGSGEEFPLQPGEGAVVVINGAIDHTQQYPESVNLNHESYFVCYNPTLYPNVSYHPVPGDKILSERYCEVLIKTGRANGYILSVNSPTLIIFRAPEGVDIEAYLADRTESTITKPGSSDICVKIPWEWVLDGVEVYNGSASNNQKRLPDSVDAGFVNLSASALGHTLHRHLDQAATAGAGYDIYIDTNNSSNDLYEREEQSLKAL